MKAECVSEGQWQARLSLQFEQGPSRTILSKREHEGPLLVQRPFYPENGVCHSYIIHPPGGVVGGDQLDINVRLKKASHALITTPGSGKFYNSHGFVAQMNQTLDVGPDAMLEWLPQDNIFFEGSHTRIKTQINLVDNARFIGWEIACLGRPFSGREFDSGKCEQYLSLSRNGKHHLVDHSHLNAGHAALTSKWGLAGYSVSGMLLATTDDKELLGKLREALSAENDYVFSATIINDVLVCRFLGSHGETARRVFEQAWQMIRPVVAGIESCSPRIWKT